MITQDKLPKQLPVFRLSTPKVSVQHLAETYSGLFGMKEFKIREQGSRLILESGSKTVETNQNSGGIWAADKAKLWRPELKSEILSEDKARKLADRLLAKGGLLPRLEGSTFVVDFSSFGRTLVVMSEGDKRSEPRQLDTQVNYSININVNGLQLPLVGGGGNFKFTFGGDGQVIGYSGVWRNVEESVIESVVIPIEEAEEKFKNLTSDMNIIELDTSLAYFSASMRVKQEFLYPVYVHRAVAMIGDERVPMRIITQPATEFGPFTEPMEPGPPRKEIQFPEGSVKYKKPILIDGLAVAEIVNPYEAGTSWIGLSGGLGGSHDNAQGFVDGLADDGWNINFNWGDAAAWESDWLGNDDFWVDAADFVFYTGHANMNGWSLSNPNNGFLHFTEVGDVPESPGDHWGAQDLEWIIVAACGPLQDELINPPGGGDVLTRWDGAFDGLHQLLGYGAVTFDNTEEGASVVEYTRDGDPIIDAWFRTAQEIQPANNGFDDHGNPIYPPPNGPTIYVGAMYVFRAGSTSPRNDHIWGHGSVAPDPTLPNIKVCMWTTT